MGASRSAWSISVDGGLVLPALVGQQAQEVQRVRLPREGGEDAPVERLGLREAPGLVLREGRLQGVAGLA